MFNETICWLRTCVRETLYISKYLSSYIYISMYSSIIIYNNYYYWYNLKFYLRKLNSFFDAQWSTQCITSMISSIHVSAVFVRELTRSLHVCNFSISFAHSDVSRHFSLIFSWGSTNSSSSSSPAAGVLQTALSSAIIKIRNLTLKKGIKQQREKYPLPTSWKR